MSIHRDAAELDRITVKIRNMKRSASRDSPTRSNHLARSSSGRSVMGRGYDNGSGVPGDSPERMSPDRLRRRIGRSPSPRNRYAVSPHHDEYLRGPPVADRPMYKVLCVSALHPKASDDFIKETLYREYKKFGDFSIRIAHDLDERVAYVCFRTPEDAREAKHHKPRIILYDKIAVVEPVFESSARNEYRPRGRSMTPPEYDRYHYPRSPMGPVPPLEHRRPPIDPYDRYAPMPIHPHGHSREYRGPIHHDYPIAPRGPPLHRMPPHLHGGPPPHQYGPIRHMGPRPHIPYEKPENKKDKFPNYLHHVQPEDDPLATRTLFAGNLEVNISDDELRRIFGKYGIVDDIDIKRPPPGTGNAFAFVRYQNLDMAHRAKLELSGQYIGKFQCKIGYGKVTPATRIWIGGLGAWTSVTQLEREFDRFGAIKKIEYQKGEPCAYIQYETVEAATAAVKEMRGFPLGGPERRLRTDFAELPGATPAPPFKSKPSYDEAAPSEYRRPEYDYHYDDVPHYAPRGGYSPYPPRGGYRGRGGFRGRGRGSYHGGYGNDVHRPVSVPATSSAPPPAGVDDEWRRPPGEGYERARSGSREPGVARSRSRSPRKRTQSPDTDSDSETHRNGSSLTLARTISDVARKCTIVWQGALVLKSSLFPAKFHLTDGDPDIIESLMRDEEGKHNLRITQRLRLDPPKLEDVQKRIVSSTSHAIFLGLSSSTTDNTNTDECGVQTRPLRNLVTYLKQKEAAGVISLLNKSTEANGVLYAFPPCDFSTELLRRTCSKLTEEGLKEDHLVVVVVRGGSA